MTVQVFPQLAGQGFWATKTPSWSTTVKQMASRRQIRTTQQAFPVWKFKVGFELIRNRPTNDELAALFAFYNNTQGGVQGFYLFDPCDNAVTAAQFALGDGSTKTFQLTRIIGASSPYPYIEPIYGVVGTPAFYVNGIATTATIGTLGTITFSSAPANGAVLTWTGQFYFLCRFSTDELDIAQVVRSLWSSNGIQIESLAP